MIQRNINVLMLLLITISPLRAGWRSDVKQAVGAECYLTARRAVRDRLRENPADKKAARIADRIDRLIKKKWRDPALSLQGRYYYRGYWAFENGRLSDARRHWYKYLEFQKKLGLPADHPQGKEVEAFYRETPAQIPLKPMAVVKPSLTENPPPALKRARRTRRKKRAEPRPSPSQAVDLAAAPQEKIQSLLEKGRGAFSEGAYEEARRYFRAAERLDPKSDEVRRELSRVEKELGG